MESMRYIMHIFKNYVYELRKYINIYIFFLAIVTSQLQIFNNGLWIGLRRSDNSPTWMWEDNTPTHFTNWGPFQPSGDVSKVY